MHPQYSLNTLNNYRFVNSVVAQSIVDTMQLTALPQLLEIEDCVCKELPQKQFCMAKPTVYDLIIDGRKVAGAAQRRSKMGYLHQGSISLQMPSNEFLEDLLRPETGVANAMQSSSYPLLGDSQDPIALNKAKYALKHALIKNFNTILYNDIPRGLIDHLLTERNPTDTAIYIGKNSHLKAKFRAG